ncbi:MAG: quinoprotein relay system zinc metallohydrolase 2 [Methylococcales symbiont of Hymedesmia sp. n. MRB-2018]|nr:MAG: quinoprotein relay system zinc metallohydrolase 2 [Methylococcales symbiont of Hymedesmia sp. n. MRB-2018]KAF3983755.1 MAG: quinoprotein relay system zinc metallohydrolase 2 [Methylococcales symbiont of Hymedesmia sp. n. MRB-2018]
MTVSEVAPGIYVHFGQHQLPDKVNHGAVANIGFIVGDTCVAVIDSGGNPDQGYALKAAIKRITDKPVCYVINTHVHPDHIYGNIAFKEKGVKFIGHKKLARAMSARGNYYIAKAAEQLDLKLTAAHIIPPDRLVKNHLAIDLGGRRLILTAQPTAHSDNDLTVFDKKTDTLWLSDLLFLDHLPVIDGSLKGWLEVMQKLQKQKFTTVIPGHGAVVTDWPNGLTAQKTYLQVLLTEIREMIVKGRFLEEAIEQVGYSEKDKWQLFDQFHKRNVTTAFAELEWE